MRILLIFGLAGWFSFVKGQDIHFTQTSQIPLLINPACAGVFDGWERVNINHRNQWLGSGTQFMTSSVAADMNLGKVGFGNNPHLGLGILVFNDVGGDSRFGSRSASLTMSGILPIAEKHTLSAAIQGGFGNRNAEFSKLYFSSQWDGTKYDQTVASGEMNTSGGFTYADASAGLYYVYGSRQNKFRRLDKFKIHLGVAGHHLNRPILKYTAVKGDRMFPRFVILSSIQMDISNSDWSLEANFVQVFQGPHRETLVGFISKYRFSNGSKITGHCQDAYFGFGSYYRLNDAICPTVQIDWKGYHFGMSYDATVSVMRKAYHGSLEFSLSYTNLNHALFKTRKSSTF